ncbi:venom carboxylesterase-6-like [Diorhabda carinulata]|uniref:venom carboxylesterase-6-like n=1 Tax=Diorhabda carinulata TaxID=1163345 RepID=UPI0025A1D78E|nr:venom carboxylesterase-6-like [Diorhabda carinulata]
MYFLTVIFIVLFSIQACICDDRGPEVETPLGIIRGTVETSVEGNPYSSFEGIPFAKPPVGELRFEEPVPIEPWLGVWNATNTHICLQTNLKGDLPILGTEDCLYLNVYVPGKTIDVNQSYPVNVHFHGGGFMMGSGDMMANSQFLMDSKNIILVSVNYRLSAFGFLSTEDEEIPGNNGMKDQVLALKWVRDNIRFFGGDSKAVTLTGYSAGGASVHLHYLSPLSRGLFAKGISHSGTAINPWVIKENPLVFAKRLADDVGCSISSTKQIKECLKTRPATVIIDKIRYYLEFGHMPFSPFAVVIDDKSKNPFLPEHPYDLMKNKKVFDAPWIASVTRDEGILPAGYYCEDKVLEEINKNFLEKAQLLLDYNYTLPMGKRSKVATQLKEYYFGKGKDINQQNFYRLVELFSHRLFTIGVEIATKLQSEAMESPVYFYYFNYDKSSNKVSKYFCNTKNIGGVSHCDDTVFAYGFYVLNAFSESDKKMRKNFKRLIETFITEDEPSFDENIKWMPTKGNELTYLNITDSDDIRLLKTTSLYPESVWADVNNAELYHMKSYSDEL